MAKSVALEVTKEMLPEEVRGAGEGRRGGVLPSATVCHPSATVCSPSATRLPPVAGPAGGNAGVNMGGF